VSINAVVFPTSLEAYMYQNGPTTQTVEYNLDHKCTRFRGTFGLSDDSQSGGQASIQATADGRQWFTHTYSLGQSDHNRIDFTTPPLKVHFDMASLVSGVDGLGAIGTPEVFCTQ
jgi:NPCBM/NEW2 domain-containing protein